jgi:hypothetical protein
MHRNQRLFFAESCLQHRNLDCAIRGIMARIMGLRGGGGECPVQFAGLNLESARYCVARRGILPDEIARSTVFLLLPIAFAACATLYAIAPSPDPHHPIRRAMGRHMRRLGGPAPILAAAFVECKSILSASYDGAIEGVVCGPARRPNRQLPL